MFAVDRLNNMKVMRGDAAEAGKLPTYRPQSTMTRAECSQVLMNLFIREPYAIVIPVPSAAEALHLAA